MQLGPWHMNMLVQHLGQVMCEQQDSVSGAGIRCRPAPKHCQCPLLPSGSCYEDVVSQLAERALQAASSQPPGRRLLVGIAGAPGSG